MDDAVINVKLDQLFSRKTIIFTQQQRLLYTA